ncbi:MAG: hemolysin family protein [Oscillospiraceae bacterium]|nr:hemolysin family protein [Oscillospiraceae bacterium]
MDITTVLFLICLLCLSALFSASETALTAANKIRLKNQAEDGNKKARGALKLVSKYDDTLSALLITNNIVNILTASLTTVLFTALVGASGVGIATAVTTVFVIIFGEVLPKTYANDNADELLKSVQGFLRILIVVLKPLIVILSVIKKSIIRKGDSPENPTVTEQELISIIDEIEDEGVLKEEEADLVQNAIEFNDIQAGEIITPRVDIVAIDKNMAERQILDLFLEYNYSRMPVYDGTIDNIIGFISQKDFSALIIRGDEYSIEGVMKPCMYVPHTNKIIDVMKLMQKDKVHMVVVTDEYGGTMGIITLEDILEELVGEIWDEHDEEKQLITKIDDTTYDVLGDTPMDDIYETLLGTQNREDSDAITVAGYLMDKLNRIPGPGDVFGDEDMYYTVTRVGENRIKKVRIKVLTRD